MRSRMSALEQLSIDELFQRALIARVFKSATEWRTMSRTELLNINLKLEVGDLEPDEGWD